MHGAVRLRWRKVQCSRLNKYGPLRGGMRLPQCRLQGAQRRRSRGHPRRRGPQWPLLAFHYRLTHHYAQNKYAGERRVALFRSPAYLFYRTPAGLARVDRLAGLQHTHHKAHQLIAIGFICKQVAYLLARGA